MPEFHFVWANRGSQQMSFAVAPSLWHTFLRSDAFYWQVGLICFPQMEQKQGPGKANCRSAISKLVKLRVTAVMGPRVTAWVKWGSARPDATALLHKKKKKERKNERARLEPMSTACTAIYIEVAVQSRA